MWLTGHNTYCCQPYLLTIGIAVIIICLPAPLYSCYFIKAQTTSTKPNNSKHCSSWSDSSTSRLFSLQLLFLLVLHVCLMPPIQMISAAIKTSGSSDCHNCSLDTGILPFPTVLAAYLFLAITLGVSCDIELEETEQKEDQNTIGMT